MSQRQENDENRARLLNSVAADVRTLIAQRDSLVSTLDNAQRTLSDALANAAMIPDPHRRGMTDCYRFSIDDVDALELVKVKIGAALKLVRP